MEQWVDFMTEEFLEKLCCGDNRGMKSWVRCSWGRGRSKTKVVALEETARKNMVWSGLCWKDGVLKETAQPGLKDLRPPYSGPWTAFWRQWGHVSALSRSSTSAVTWPSSFMTMNLMGSHTWLPVPFLFQSLDPYFFFKT